MPNLKKAIPSLFLVALVIFGIGLAVFQSGKADAASAPAPVIGVVDYSYLLNHHPGTPKANQALQAAQDQAKKEYTEKVTTLKDKERQDLERQLQSRVEQKRQELLKPLMEQINAAIKTVAEGKKLTMVVHKNAVVYGGLDITTEVAKKLGAK
ncbi:periplasmic chaperone for outer membrane proteins Skp [Hydrogenispora ethanolica]|jgi:outer membrane protein|uniref:Periplasmic chaperone for outer membrane proteins Skp n=1 Tax=Hydrogenispora ethanolica TaxID=1082276 RepID=A0A4V2QGC1_HYDET|nr:OmpH family outer membrane protein [Hydrogenispora ethanolica]TCL75227.1 periplasmic chaperone for outer membrane proteins Skp [Hydrogenispora ethanolica]